MSSPPEPVRLELPSDPALLPVVRSTLFALAETCPTVRLLRDELDELAVALQEACTNAVRHGNALDAAKPLRVTFVRRSDALEIRVEDEGAPFVLDSGPGPDPLALAEGGYGMSIMHAWTDELTLVRTNGRNVLTLVRRYRAPVDSQEIDRVAAC